jgi:hypothetical protein
MALSSFCHKALKPAWLFVNCIQTLVAIDEGTRQDLHWFIACAHVANGSLSFDKCLGLQTDIFMAVSLSSIRG